MAEEAGVPHSDLTAVIEGAEPKPDIVRRLGPVLGFHTADMFVLAGLAVPQELASAWPTSPWDVGAILRYAVRMSPQQRSRVGELVQTLPVQLRIGPTSADGYPEGREP